MTASPAPSNHPVFLLAEHLDMILAAIEELEACRPTSAPQDPLMPSGPTRLSMSSFVDDLQRFEAAAIMRVARARDLTRALVRRDKRFAMLGGLFVSGTASLDEAMRRMGDDTGTAFERGLEPVAYLRSRGAIADDAGGIDANDGIAIGDGFRLAGEIEVGPLVDLVSTFLNTIELHFDLFPELSEPSDVSKSNELVI